MDGKLWPLFELRVRTPRLELRYPDDADLEALARITDDIHEPGYMPFHVPWSTRPAQERERATLQWHWQMRGRWTPASWGCEFVVVVDGEIAGAQGINATEFATLRVAHTGSWLNRRWQGRGIGKEMRAAVLHFGFVGLSAVAMESGAYADNAASIAVSRGLGYEENGIAFTVRQGERAEQVNFLMRREVWEERRRDDIVIEGLEPALPLFGVDRADG